MFISFNNENLTANTLVDLWLTRITFTVNKRSSRR